MPLQKTVDVHAHWWPPAFLDRLDLEAERGNPAHNVPAASLVRAPDVVDLEARLRLMDDAGIDLEVLSNPSQMDERARPGTATLNNDELEAACARGWDRFRFYASLPLPDVGASLAELERALALEHCVGVILPTHVHGESLDDARFLPILEALDGGAVSVFLHPDGFRAQGLLAEWFMDWSIGATFEDTIVVMRLISSGRRDALPRIRWIVPHLGGALPFLWQRLEKQYQATPHLIGMSQPPSAYARGFLYDTANQDAETMTLAVSRQGAEALVLGTDFPFVDRWDMRGALVALCECPSLDDAAVAEIMRRGVA